MYLLNSLNYPTKKSHKVVNLPLTNEKLRLSFWRHKQVKWLLWFSTLSLGSYVSFELVSQNLYIILEILLIINRNNFFELTYYR